MSANSIAEKFEVIADAVYEKGQDDGVTAFLNEFQQNGNRKNYQACFGPPWTKEMLAKLPYVIKPENAYMLFWSNTTEHLVITDFVEFCNGCKTGLDFSECKTAIYALARLHTRHFGVLDFRKCTSLNTLFYSHNADGNCVTKIDEFISSETTKFSNDTFQHATYLEELNMSGVVATSINFGECPLNKQSLESVKNVLSTTTTGLTATFKKTAVNAAFGVNVDDVSTYTEEFNEWRNSRKNWTFSYV